jgi:hypothetical protein
MDREYRRRRGFGIRIANESAPHPNRATHMKLPLAAVLLPIATAAGQCPNLTLQSTMYGQHCYGIYSTPALLSVNVNPNPNTCSLAGWVSGAPGPGSWTRIGTVLALGTQPSALPIDLFGVQCTLYTLPTILTFDADPFGFPAIFVLPVPPNLPPVTFQLQGGVLWSSTNGDARMSLSAGHTITLQ